MFRFANPEYLYLLLLLPVVWVLYFTVYGVIAAIWPVWGVPMCWAG